MKTKQVKKTAKQMEKEIKELNLLVDELRECRDEAVKEINLADSRSKTERFFLEDLHKKFTIVNKENTIHSNMVTGLKEIAFRMIDSGLLLCPGCGNVRVENGNVKGYRLCSMCLRQYTNAYK
jgi:hypothetical protein